MLGCDKSIAPTSNGNDQANIVLIVADDLGFTDPGFMGSEISTPNLDALAKNGVLLNNFYVAPTCSPTRAMLLTGTDPHLAGIGTMAEAIAPNQENQPGYEGYLNDRVVTVSTLLRDAGYHTYMTGKWHLGFAANQSPRARGFERSFAMLPGSGSHFEMSTGPERPVNESYREDGNYVDRFPDDFYSSDFFTQQMIGYIDANLDDRRPFFAYLAYTAPHWPLHVPEQDRNIYRGMYDEGYDVWRQRRIEGAMRVGAIPHEVGIPPDLSPAPAWEELSAEQQALAARKMELYAAMVEIMDRNIGALIAYLDEFGVLENTVVIFLSDNGADGMPLEALMPAEWLQGFDNSFDKLGSVDSYTSYGSAWAQVSTGPFRYWKFHATEGGVRAPAFLFFGDAITRPGGSGSVSRLTSAMDIAPTILDFAGVPHPGEQYDGREILPPRGRSLLPALIGENGENRHQVAGELFHGRYLRRGDWKAVWDIDAQFESSGGPWQLFNLAEDPAELTDLASEFPEILAELVDAWESYADETGVILPAYE